MDVVLVHCNPNIAVARRQHLLWDRAQHVTSFWFSGFPNVFRARKENWPTGAPVARWEQPFFVLTFSAYPRPCQLRCTLHSPENKGFGVLQEQRLLQSFPTSHLAEEIFSLSEAVPFTCSWMQQYLSELARARQ